MASNNDNQQTSGIEEVEGINTTLSNLALTDSRDDLANCMARPNFGVEGRKITVHANVFPITVTRKSMIIYQYDILIEKAVKSKGELKAGRELSWKIWKQLCAKSPGHIKRDLEAASFDRQSNFYTPYKLKLSNPVVTIRIELPDTTATTEKQKQANTFKCTIKLVREVDLHSLVTYCQGGVYDEATSAMVAAAKAAINVLLRQDLYDRYLQKGGKGRRFFTLENLNEMSDGGRILNGFIQSVIPTQSGQAALQVTYGPFFKPNILINILEEIVSGRGGGLRGRGGYRAGDRGNRGEGGAAGNTQGNSQLLVDGIWKQKKQFEILLNRTRFNLTHRQSNQPLQIDGLTDKNANELLFKMANPDGGQDTMISVTDFYKKVHNITLSYPCLPLVRTAHKGTPKQKIKDNNNGQNKDKNKDNNKYSFYPMELVKLTDFNGIPFTAVSSSQTAEMIKVTAKRPEERKASIMKWRQELDYSSLPRLKDWCLEISPFMMEVNARILDPPEVRYKGSFASPNYGTWGLNRHKFVKANKDLRA
ncbi:uncharacterized protein I206_101868 [Kwoniella pini CBS 10737]|uniref:PAZ domain-containing protein n=1 Tax=Kwoniella pini CBS 10737 TaxID=1296096 RepID=A0AAJ8L0K6_9TREE